MKDLLISLSKEKPLVVFLEDVHWMDKISESLFTYFARCIIDQPIFMLSAYRPEGTPTWAQGAHYQRLGIETLSSKSSVHLVRNMLNVPTLEQELEEKIVEKTEGNPLFVEEIVKELCEYLESALRSDEVDYKNCPISGIIGRETTRGILTRQAGTYDHKRLDTTL